MSKKKNALWAQMPLEDQKKLKPYLRAKKYQVNLQLADGTKKFMYLDEPQVATVFALQIKAKILKVIKLWIMLIVSVLHKVLLISLLKQA